MPDVREVYEMVTKQKPSDPGALERQHTRQIRTARNRKIGGFVAAAAVIAAVAVALSVALEGTPPEQTAGNPSGVPVTNPPPYSATVVSTDGDILEVVPGVPSDASNLEFSPDGQTIAFMQQNDLWTIGRDGTHLRVLDAETHTPDRTPEGDAQEGIAWSPDGTRLAFVLGEDIYVIDSDGSNMRQLTTAPGGDYQPAWSSQNVIAYWHGSSSGVDGGPPNSEIYTIPAEGGTPTRLTHDDVSSIAPAWSPDGTQIVHWEGGELSVMGADGSGAHSLGIGGWSPAWSPDGSTIAFLACCESYYAPDGAPLLEVRLLDLDTGTEESLAHTVPTDWNGPSWSPEGALLFLRYD